MTTGRSHFVDDKDAQCTGKTKYVSKARAKVELKRSSIPHRDDLKPYLCPWCGYWHFGTKAGRKRKQNKRAILPSTQQDH
jgi:hypothetical protein